MKVEDLVGYDVIRTQPIDLGLFVDTSYMYYPVHVNKVDTYNHTVVVSDFKFNYQAILGVEWLDDNWEKAGDINQYKEPQYDKLNHIIKKGEHPKSMQDIMANAKAVTTNRVGDPDIFDNADGIITAGLEQATQEEADNFIKHLGANGSDYDSDYIKKESYKNDDLSNESILNNVLTTIDELRSGKVNGPNADALTIKLLIRKMDSMGVIPRNVDDDNKKPKKEKKPKNNKKEEPVGIPVLENIDVEKNIGNNSVIENTNPLDEEVTNIENNNLDNVSLETVNEINEENNNTDTVTNDNQEVTQLENSQKEDIISEPVIEEVVTDIVEENVVSEPVTEDVITEVVEEKQEEVVSEP